MRILSWNIQATKGCDDRYDLDRIVDHINEYDDLDVICLQEVAKHMPEFNNNDQPKLVHHQFPDFDTVWGPGFSASDGAGILCEFGNMTLVKSAVFKTSRVHLLPRACVQAPCAVHTMIETVIGAVAKKLVLFNTHLAFHPTYEQRAQIQGLTLLRDQVLVRPGTAGVILCGDLNMSLGSMALEDCIRNQCWVDCWTAQPRIVIDNDLQRPHTCGCYDHKLWPEGAHTRDYFLASERISHKIIRVEVDLKTDASDHQPVLLEIDL